MPVPVDGPSNGPLGISPPDDGATTSTEPDFDWETDEATGMAEAPEPEPVVAEREPEAPAADDFNEELLSRAASWGFEKGDFSSAAAMRKALTRFEAQHRQEVAQPQEAPKAFDPWEGIDPETFDPEAKKVIDRLNERLEGVTQREQQYQAAMQHMASLEQKRITDEIDSVFDGMNERYSGRFGQGSIFKLQPNAPERLMRQKVVDQARILEAGYWHHGMQPPPMVDLLQRAAQMEFGADLAREELGQQIKQRRSQFVSQPTSRKGRELRGKSAAVAETNDMLRRFGLPVHAGGDDEI